MATILSAQSTDKMVNQVTPGLFKKYPTIQDFAALRPEVLARDIHSTGFFNNKAKSVVGAAKKILADFDGQVPRTMEEMLTIPGAARKTSNVVLGTAYGIASGVVVDTHVQRISGRLDLTKNTDPVKIERDLEKIIPQGKMDSVFAPDHPPRPRAVHGAKAALRRMQDRAALLLARQDGVRLRWHRESECTT